MADNINEFLWWLKTYTFVAADAVDRQADSLAALIRESLSDCEWLPEGARPVPLRVVVPERVTQAAGGSKGQWWIESKWTVGMVVAGVVVAIGGYGYMRKKKYQKRRRAKKAGNGGRKEVVGLGPLSPLGRSGFRLMHA